ncbi:apolipoprotein N-acyltransferase [Undibacterium sp. WLX3042]|uniref:apolipoprotein N-acyltransferase n=1 Tax=Undibacterium sp. WLX3042 TaxID=3412686 RepID=UPI003C2AD623
MLKRLSPAVLLSALSFGPALLVMAVAGVVTVSAFAPFGLWPLQLLSMAVFVALLLGPRQQAFSVLQSAALGWVFSFFSLFTATSWLLVAMTRYGGMPVFLAVIALALLAFYLALFAGLCAAALAWIRQRWRVPAEVCALLIFPPLWLLNEWLRGCLFTGFPWAITGYAHTSSPLAGYAPVIGVLGLGWLVAFCAGALGLMICSDSKRLRLPVLAAVVLLFGGGHYLHKITWTQPQGQALTISLIQGNVEQDKKFDQAHLYDSLRLYHDLILQSKADLVVTPETALPMLSSQLPPDYLPAINTFAQKNQSAVLIGLAVHDGGSRYANSVLGFSPRHEQQAYRYDKHHLVPFGEFIPFGFRWFVDLMHIPLGDFTKGDAIQVPMQVRDQFVLPNICYEDLFGDEIAAQLASQNRAGKEVASLLLNVSNMAWYGDSIAIPQHLQFSVMRVLETGRPMLRATNTGATAVIDVGGQLVNQLPYLQQGILQAKVQGRQGMTPYALWGNTSVMLLVLCSLLLAAYLSRRSAGSRQGEF